MVWFSGWDALLFPTFSPCHPTCDFPVPRLALAPPLLPHLPFSPFAFTPPFTLPLCTHALSLLSLYSLHSGGEQERLSCLSLSFSKHKGHSLFLLHTFLHCLFSIKETEGTVKKRRAACWNFCDLAFPCIVLCL